MDGAWKKLEGVAYGVFTPYKNRMVVIFRTNHRKSTKPENATPRLVLSPVVLTALGNPKRIDIYQRGSNIGIMAAEKGALKLTTSRLSDFLYVSGKTIQNTFNLKPGAYDCHVEEGNMIVFDSAQKPSEV